MNSFCFHWRRSTLLLQVWRRSRRLGKEGVGRERGLSACYMWEIKVLLTIIWASVPCRITQSSRRNVNLELLGWKAVMHSELAFYLVFCFSSHSLECALLEYLRIFQEHSEKTLSAFHTSWSFQNDWWLLTRTLCSSPWCPSPGSTHTGGTNFLLPV